MSEEITTDKLAAASAAEATAPPRAVATPYAAEPTATSSGALTAPAEIKIKVRKTKQRACDEKNAKGKLCGGHLKRWYGYPQEVARKIGKDAEIYRCEFCKTLYKPDPKQMLHSFTQRF